MEHVVCSSIMNHANMHNILYLLQHGFRARRSRETQLIDLVNDIANNKTISTVLHLHNTSETHELSVYLDGQRL